MPRFTLYTWGSLRQCRRAPGFQAGSLLGDRKLTFWTMTVWQDQAAMRAYMTRGMHLNAMPKLQTWCDEASVVHWTQDDAAMPSWQDADRRMRTNGRPSRVRKPSDVHATLAFAEPRLSGAVPIRPATRRKGAPEA